MFDIILTGVAATGISYWRPWGDQHKLVWYEVLLIFIILWIIGIILHVAFNQKTMLNYYLNLSEKPDIMKNS